VPDDDQKIWYSRSAAGVDRAAIAIDVVVGGTLDVVFGDGSRVRHDSGPRMVP